MLRTTCFLLLILGSRLLHVFTAIRSLHPLLPEFHHDKRTKSLLNRYRYVTIQFQSRSPTHLHTCWTPRILRILVFLSCQIFAGCANLLQLRLCSLNVCPRFRCIYKHRSDYGLYIFTFVSNHRFLHTVMTSQIFYPFYVLGSSPHF